MSTAAVPRAPSKLRSLFTKEDKFNFHKTLGIFALLHFLFRFAHVGPSDMRFKANHNPEHRPTPDPLTLASGSDLSAQPVSNSRGRLSH